MDIVTYQISQNWIASNQLIEYMSENSNDGVIVFPKILAFLKLKISNIEHGDTHGIYPHDEEHDSTMNNQNFIRTAIFLGIMFLFFRFGHYFGISASLLLCSSAFLLRCFSASPLFCFSAVFLFFFLASQAKIRPKMHNINTPKPTLNKPQPQKN